MTQDVKPNLIIVGAMKASSSLLQETLCRHPDVWMPAQKEPHFFTKGWGGEQAWQKYLDLFAPCPPGKRIIGEASTSYTKLPCLGPTPQRIREKLGQPKLMYIIRDPVARCVSNYRHSYMRGFYMPGTTFAQALRKDAMLATGSTYARQITEYQKEFGQDGILVIIAEELYKDPSKVMRDVERYLELPPMDAWDQPLEKVNSAAKVKTGVAWDNVVGVKWRYRIAGVMPRWTKRFVENFVTPKVREAPPVSKEDEEICFEMIRDDLRDLHTMLGDRIANWQSVKKLQDATRERSRTVSG